MRNRILALLLTGTLLAGLLTGCGNQAEEPTEQEASTSTAEQNTETKYAYQASYLDLNVDASYQLNYIDEYCIQDHFLYFAGTCVTGTEVYTDEATGEPLIDETTGEPMETNIYESALFRYDLDTNETVRLENYRPAEIPEGMEGNASLCTMAAGTDGTLWVIDMVYTYSFDLPEDFDVATDSSWDYYVPGETLVVLRQLDSEGQEIKSVDLSIIGDSYPSQLLLDQNGNLYIDTYVSIYVLDAEGALLMELDNENGSNLSQISASEIGVTTYNYTENAASFTFRKIDLETKGYGEEIELASYSSRLYPGSEPYQYLYSYNDAVYGYNAETEESEKLFSWLDCDVNSNNFNEFTILPDGRVVALCSDFSSDSIQYELLCMEQVDASTLPQKQELTLACMYLDMNTRNAVLDFNRSHSDIRITVKNYSEYNTEDDYTAGQTKLNTEILSGVMPDILCVDSLPVDQYAAKGVLMDLWPLIDSDAELSRDDLMTHLFDVMSINGKLYEVTDSFYINTAVGNADIIGDRTGWTLEELLETMNLLDENATIFGESDTKDSMLSNCVSRNINHFIDWEEMTCSFDNQEFIDMLNFANSFPAEFDWSNYDWEDAESEYSRFQTNRQLLTGVVLSDFNYMQMYGVMVGGNPVYVGYPSADGNGSSFSVSGSLAISTSCKDVDAAWSFVRTILTEEYQKEYDSWAFPTNAHAFDALVEEQMTPEYWTNPETGEKEELSSVSYGIGNDLWVDIYAMTQEEYDAFMRLYESCNSIYTYNNTVYEIIQEEAAAFFDGQKTAEETAKIIQDRVGLYVMEQG